MFFNAFYPLNLKNKQVKNILKLLTTIFILLANSHQNYQMTLQSILIDPNIAQFLQQIPQKEHVITLKELIYIGIKIVTNSVNENQKRNNNSLGLHRDKAEKQNRNRNFQKQSNSKKNVGKDSSLLKRSKNDVYQQKYAQSGHYSENSPKIESTLLRQISKIRMQLENLTNKVYDHYFQEKQNNDQEQLQVNADKNWFEQKRFNYGQDMPTFSPQKDKEIVLNTLNPFLKQKNNFFVTEPVNQLQQQGKHYQKTFSNQKSNKFQQNNKFKSKVMHLDDAQIRQALYKGDSQAQRFESANRSRAKKSHSLIQKRVQQKKKDQQHYFYELAVDKQRIEQFERAKRSKSSIQPPERDYNDNKSSKVVQQANPYLKKAKSKIKKLVDRDRLRFKQKMSEYNFQKGFEQYQYSANELNEDSSDEEEKQIQNEEEMAQNQAKVPSQSHDAYSPQLQFESSRQAKNPNFGFYSNQANKSPDNNYNEQEEEEDNINICSNSSSFSQFSMSSSSRRQIGKISRRKHD